jgi:hypothetical protein
VTRPIFQRRVKVANLGRSRGETAESLKIGRPVSGAYARGMTTAAALADELGVSEGDIRLVAAGLLGDEWADLLTDEDADEVRGILDPDVVRAVR